MPPPYAAAAVDAGFATLGEAAVYRRSGQPDLPLKVLPERAAPIAGLTQAEIQRQSEGYQVREADLAAAGLSPPLKGDVIELAPDGVPGGAPRKVQGAPRRISGDLVWQLDMVPA